MKARVVSIAGVAMAAGLMAAPSALAETALAETPQAGTVVMWEDTGYGGDLYVDATSTQCPDGRCEIDGWDGDNEISSIKNHSGCTVRIFSDDGFMGDYRDIGDGVEHPSLGGLGFDNEAESFQFLC